MRRGTPTDRQHPDAGYTMLEVVVAMAIFTLLAGSVLTVLTGTLRLNGDNARRAAAADLASAQVEQARSMDARAIPDGLTTRTQAVGGTTYTVAQTANYLAADASTAVCSGGGDQLAYKLVRVAVTWPSMGTTKPVTADTLRALGVGTDGLDATRGSLAVSVQGAHSNPTSGVLVTLSSGATRTTGSDGCAVFTGLVPASYTASIDQVGSVSAAGTQATTTSGLVVTAGTVQRAVLTDDAVRSQSFALAPPAGYALPTGLSVALHGAAFGDAVLPSCATGGARTCTTAVPGTVANLFPDTYSLWAGTCADAAASPATFDASPVGGSGGSVVVPLAGVSATAMTASGAAAVGRTLYAVHLDDAGTGLGVQCPTGEVVALGTTGATGGLASALPFGTWTISTTSDPDTATGPRVVLTKASPTGSAAVVVP